MTPVGCASHAIVTMLHHPINIIICISSGRGKGSGQTNKTSTNDLSEQVSQLTIQDRDEQEEVGKIFRLRCTVPLTLAQNNPWHF